MVWCFGMWRRLHFNLHDVLGRGIQMMVLPLIWERRRPESYCWLGWGWLEFDDDATSRRMTMKTTNMLHAMLLKGQDAEL